MPNREYERETRRHREGTVCLVGGAGFLLFACFAMPGGTGAVLLGTIGVCAVLAGVLLHIFNRSPARIDRQRTHTADQTVEQTPDDSTA